MNDRFSRDKGRVLRPNDLLGLLTVDIPTCICADAFLLARASLQIRLQPWAVVASRLLKVQNEKKKKSNGEEMRGNIMRIAEGERAGFD